MRARRFLQVDVFGSGPYLGNPLAVVVDGAGLTDADMQRFARWTNLSETTFLLPPTTAVADYRVRIFTTDGELPFAGHPTLGSAHVWRRAGGEPRTAGRIVQECGVGLVELREQDGRWAFAAPPLHRYGPVEPEVLARARDALGLGEGDVLDASWLDNGPHWIGLRLRSAADVLAVRPRYDRLGDLFVGVVGPGGAADVEVRAFMGTGAEDPVTGSLNAGLAVWLTETGEVAAPYVAAQGTALGRAGRVHVTAADGRLWIGGDVHEAVEGTVRL